MDNQRVRDFMINKLPPGFKFNPDDIELIQYYLKPKIAGDPILVPRRIHDIDIYKHSPYELETYKYRGEKYIYFFTPRNKKYRNGTRPDRATGDFGYWKATGKEESIRTNNGNIVIGSKRNLVYMEGNPNRSKERKGEELSAVKTNWMMQEYTINKEINDSAISKATSPLSEMHLDDWVLCKIYKNDRENYPQKRKHQEVEELNTL
ncbi:NAC domain-containing protein 2-like [Lotus japonicus]|uniref:NAC domain-containing protein 2-like n=1 Tax=Lotus japonicus TaxID=34305 RepID=UPI00258678BD|nr:NAC domain-containing protein 2-like [Lotus japonicus]